MAEDESKIILYTTDDGRSQVSFMLRDGRVWLNQKQLADLFNTTKQNVNQHIKAIYDSGELDRNRTVKKYLTVQTEGTRSIGRHVDHYNLDMIIALDDQLKRLRAKLLTGKEKVSHDEAMKKAEREFTIYRQREMRQLKSDFDKAVRGYLGGPTDSK